MTMDFDALFAGLAFQVGGDGYTTAEIMEQTGMSPELTRRRIKQALAAGLCRVGRKLVQRIDGRVAPVPAYVFEGR
ncbi:hypothetical protein DFW101_3526 [Solidesulfovibrio carbinoliphilus subsp. oakridgensis]|uniref:Uncharacterized protein n=2 Tax=Solidesulfovibrio carbinoliphilus TaxID=345370 RepID=G7QC76_9BACT|nr:hypothetical protein DFW101_3526 [Solidesulfovibrio carbinoliphilus subsp. oakridgensis]